mgnify:CR=1 FL=1
MANTSSPTVTNQINPIGSEYISKTSKISVQSDDGGFFHNREDFYTGITLVKTSNNPPTYRKDIYQYDSARSTEKTLIGKVNENGEVELNENTNYGGVQDKEEFRAKVQKQIKNQTKDAEKKIKTAVNQDKVALSNSETGSGEGDGKEDGLGTNPDTRTDLEKLQDKKSGLGKKGSYGNMFYPSFIERSAQDKLKITILEFAPKKRKTKQVQKTRDVFVKDGYYNPNSTAGSVTVGPIPKYTKKQENFTDTVFSDPRDNFTFDSRKRVEFGKRTLGSILLPIPDGISDVNKVDYKDGNLNPAQAFFADSVSAAFLGEGEGPGETIADAFDAAGKKSEDVKKALGGFFASKTLGLSGNEVLARTQGQIFNNNLELLFNGPTLRDFNFQFKISPRDDDETKQVKKIIRALKQSSAVQKSKSGIFLVSPNTYKLEFKQGNRGPQSFLPKFKECALLQVSVNYMPEGSYMTYEDTSMVTYLLTLSFREIEPIFNSDYEEHPDSIGF